MRVYLAEESDAKEWDEYVTAHPDSCVFQTFAWRRVVATAYGHQPLYLVAREGAEIRGVLPLFLIRSLLFGRVMATCPYASWGAICSSGVEAERALVEEAINLSRQHQVDYIELKSIRTTQAEGLQVRSHYVTYELPLDAPETLWRQSLRKSNRVAIRQAEKFGLSLEQGAHLLDEFHKVFVANMRALGTPVHALRFFSTILEVFGESAALRAATRQAEVLAAMLLLRYRNRVSVVYAASLPDSLPLRPNNFLYWQVIKEAATSGAATFDFGRSLAGTGVAKFKESWGTAPAPLYYEYFLNRARTAPDMNASNPRYDLARKVWKRMPLPLTKWLGPALIRSIP